MHYKLEGQLRQQMSYCKGKFSYHALCNLTLSYKNGIIGTLNSLLEIPMRGMYKDIRLSGHFFIFNNVPKEKLKLMTLPIRSLLYTTEI